MDNENCLTGIVTGLGHDDAYEAFPRALLAIALDNNRKVEENAKPSKESSKKTEEKNEPQKYSCLKSDDEFKVGDKVIVRLAIGDQIGTIKYIAAADEFSLITRHRYAIEFEKYPAPGYGHDCKGHCKSGKGYWAAKNELEHYREPEFKIIIESKGDTTKAKLIHGKSVDKTAEVKRCSTDKYSEKDAAKYVVAKLFGEKSAPAFPANGMIEWIDAKKNPPKESKQYLVYFGDRRKDHKSTQNVYTILNYSVRHKKWNCCDYTDARYAIEDVTHYAKLNNPGEWNLIKKR
jgi:hypothetical protein